MGQVVSVGLDGGVGFLLFRQFVFAVVGYEFADRFRNDELGIDGVAKRIRGSFRVPLVRIADDRSESPFSIGACAVGFVISTEHPHIGTGFALQSQEASLLYTAHADLLA
jgi:hypothetical protein